MTYEEAKKAFTAIKPKDNYMLVRIGYDKEVVLPYKDGVNLLNCFASAEQLVDRWGDKCRIIGFDAEYLRFEVLSSNQYRQIKMAQLLGISLNSIQEMEKAEASSNS